MGNNLNEGTICYVIFAKRTKAGGTCHEHRGDTSLFRFTIFSFNHAAESSDKLDQG